MKTAILFFMAIFGMMAANAQTVTMLTEEKATTTVTTKVWLNGIPKVRPYEYYTAATVSNGSVTFWLTDNNASTGLPVFTEIYPESITLMAWNSSKVIIFNNVVISADKKKITADVKQITSVLVGLLNFETAANGLSVSLTVKGM